MKQTPKTKKIYVYIRKEDEKKAKSEKEEFPKKNRLGRDVN